MKLAGRRVLVTGSDGFIGSHVVEELIERGAKVRAFVFYNSFDSWGWLDHLNPKIQKEIEVFPGDVRDALCVRTAAKGCDAILHLAALIGIPYSYLAPESYIDTNVKGTLNIVQAARELGIERVVHTSTSEVYGTARSVPISEEHPLQGQSPYAASKTAADQLALSFWHSFDTKVTVVRPFNTYGPRQSTRAVIPTVITQLASGKTDLKLGSLHPTRDFSFVTDTARGVIACAESDEAVGQTINLGSGFEVSIQETAETIASLMGKAVSFDTEKDRVRPKASEVERLWADNTKAAKLLGWKPEYAGKEGFKRGLEQTIRWFSDSSNLSRYKVGRYTV